MKGAYSTCTKSCALRGKNNVAIFYCQTNSVSRSAGRSAVAAAAYRSASELLDQRTGLVHDYTSKGGVAETLILLPDDAPPLTRNELWNSAESAERRSDSRTAREWIVALPAELNAQQRSALTTEFAQCLVDRFGVGVDVAIHQPDTAGDQRNHHAHLLCTTRQINEHGLGEKSTIELSDSARRKRGLTAVSDEVAAVRKLWADTANLALNHAGHAVQIDQRSLTARGIDREPTTHLGAAATAMERRGQKSELGGVNRAVEQRNTERRQLTGKLIDLQAERERRQHQQEQKALAEKAAMEKALAEKAVIEKVTAELKVMEKALAEKAATEKAAELKEQIRAEHPEVKKFYAAVAAAGAKPAQPSAERGGLKILENPTAADLPAIETVWNKLHNQKFEDVQRRAARIQPGVSRALEAQKQLIRQHQKQEPTLSGFRSLVPGSARSHEKQCERWEQQRRALNKRAETLENRANRIADYSRAGISYPSAGQKLATAKLAAEQPNLRGALEQSKKLAEEKRYREWEQQQKLKQSRSRGRGGGRKLKI